MSIKNCWPTLITTITRVKLSVKDLQDRMKSKKALYDHRQDKTSASKWISEEELKTINHKFFPRIPNS